ncbi:hypothetical protein K227x_06150 [Rubripirellula lacrimiformis]|uniref:Uncharacterized protein n=1 Tax=Rubripirellula lacrimiformis TaxID=1930273 RepID=A0A517N533_9BACT|nr:hypothetical protein [Rubripirellula lacrimiformis]QDT02242.1 hypothetical protein K227x_06150 [Rubripirellula lacrimiformis]
MNATLQATAPSRQNVDAAEPTVITSLLRGLPDTCVVIPPAQVRRMKPNPTPAMIAPLRGDWWLGLAWKCVGGFATPDMSRGRARSSMSSLGASRYES